MVGALRVLKMVFVLSLVIGAVSLAENGDLYSGIGQSPDLDGASNLSSEGVQKNESLGTRVQMVTENGTVTAISGSRVSLVYDGAAERRVNVSLVVIDSVEEQSEATLRVPQNQSSCSDAVRENSSTFASSQFEGTEVAVLPLSNTSSNGTYHGMVFQRGVNESIGQILVGEGYAVTNETAANKAFGHPSKFLARQEVAQNEERGIWRCVPESDEPDIQVNETSASEEER